MIGLDQIFSMRNRNRKSMMARKSSRVGFTLLELLLALGLSIVVVVAIGMAIQTFLIALTKQQAMIERKQIARSVISMISNDLRAGIQYKATDYSGLEKKIQDALAAATGGTTDPDEEPEDSGVIDEEQVDFRPTFIGDSGVVMIDISHLPRLDQYNPFVATEESKVQTPSDVKSVAYFFSASDGGMEDQLEMAQARAPGGLYRRELDRAVATYAGDTQMVGGPDQYTRLIASEIAQVSFRYFDGEDWQEEWDSDEDGGFPAAVEITVVIDAERSVETTQSSNFGVVSQESAETYTKVVNLPIADRPSSSEE